MSRSIFSLMLFSLVFMQMSLADQLFDKCSSPVGHTDTEIEILLRQAAKDVRKDCIQALVANRNFNNRSYTLRIIPGLAPAEQALVLQTALQFADTWTPPLKIGEEIAAFEGVTDKYVQLLQAIGVKATNQQLLSETGRIELVRLFNGAQDQTPEPASNSTGRESSAPSNQDDTPPVSRLPADKTPKIEAPPLTSEEPTSSKSWRIIVVMIVAGLGLLWLLLKRRS